MFTGIIEETGVVARIKESTKAIHLTVRAQLCARGTKAGDSIAVNGCCLTVTKISRTERDAVLHFDLLRETWTRTNLQFSAPGCLV